MLFFLLFTQATFEYTSLKENLSNIRNSTEIFKKQMVDVLNLCNNCKCDLLLGSLKDQADHFAYLLEKWDKIENQLLNIRNEMENPEIKNYQNIDFQGINVSTEDVDIENFFWFFEPKIFQNIKDKCKNMDDLFDFLKEIDYLKNEDADNVKITCAFFMNQSKILKKISLLLKETDDFTAFGNVQMNYNKADFPTDLNESPIPNSQLNLFKNIHILSDMVIQLKNFYELINCYFLLNTSHNKFHESEGLIDFYKENLQKFK